MSTFKIMVIADTHGTLVKSILDRAVDENETPNVVFCLGDLSYWDLDLVANYFDEANIYLIFGNHDTKRLEQEFREDHINDHRIVFVDDYKNEPIKVDIEGKLFTLVGISGSVKYKDDDSYFMLTQKDSHIECCNLPSADVFICHDKPLFDANSLSDDAKISESSHCGLCGIGDYVDKNKPKYLFHGHLHRRYEDKRDICEIHGCYEAQFFEIEV